MHYHSLLWGKCRGHTRCSSIDFLQWLTKLPSPNPFGMRCKAAACRSDPVSKRRTSLNKVRYEWDGTRHDVALPCVQRRWIYSDKCIRRCDRDGKSALRWRITMVYTLSCLFCNHYPRSFRFRCVNDEEKFGWMSFMPILINSVVIKSAGPTGRLLGIYMFPTRLMSFLL